MIYRSAQEAVLDALRSGQLPAQLAALVDPQTGLVNGEINPGLVREFDAYTGQTHYQYALPTDMSGINPGMLTVNPEAGPVPPNMMPVGGQAAFSNSPQDWAASKQPGQPGLQWGAQPMGDQRMPLAQPLGASPGSYANPVQMDPMGQLSPGLAPRGAPGGMPAGMQQNPSAPFGPGGVNPAWIQPGPAVTPRPTVTPGPATQPGLPTSQAPAEANAAAAVLARFFSGLGAGGPQQPQQPSLGQVLNGGGQDQQSQISNLYQRGRVGGTGRQ